MAPLVFKYDHNKVVYFGEGKQKEHVVFEPMVEYLKRSKIFFALTCNPENIYRSLVQQFWATATKVPKDDPTEIKAVVEGKEFVITEGLIRE